MKKKTLELIEQFESAHITPFELAERIKKLATSEDLVPATKMKTTGREKVVKEENKLIAEFLGYEHKPEIANDFYHHKKKAGHILRLDETKFHEDWNLLMLAVEEIEDRGYIVLIDGISCKIYVVLSPEKPIVSFVLGNRKNKIALVHKTIVEFIKLYNKTQ